MKGTVPETPDIPAGLLANAKARSSDVVAKLHRAMREMELEIEQNDGLYPVNGGRISTAEVCRRAGIVPGTLHTPAHNNTTRIAVEEWRKNAIKLAVQGVKRIRRTVTDRADNWKQAHSQIATAYHRDKLEVVNLKAALRAAEERVKALERDNAALLFQLEKTSSSNVLPMPRGKK